MLLGVCEHHPTGTFRFLDMQKRSIVRSRDVVWQNRYYGESRQIDYNDRDIVENNTFKEKYFVPELDQETNNKQEVINTRPVSYTHLRAHET